MQLYIKLFLDNGGSLKHILKALTLIISFALLLLYTGEPLQAKTVNNNSSKVIAYYFRNNFRCSNCFKIENFTKEALNKNFSKELKNGKLVYKVINFEEDPNKHFIEDYQLYTKSVILSKIKDGKQIEWKNLDKIWVLLGDQDKFQEYIKAETTKFLKEAK